MPMTSVLASFHFSGGTGFDVTILDRAIVRVLLAFESEPGWDLVQRRDKRALQFGTWYEEDE